MPASSAPVYDVAQAEGEFIIKRIGDVVDARPSGGIFSKPKPASNRWRLTSQPKKRLVQYIPTLVSQAEIRDLIKKAGFEAVILGDEAEDAEAKAREKEIGKQRNMLILGIIFTLPLFILSMGRDIGLIPMEIRASSLVRMASVCPGHPGAIYRGRPILRRGV